MKEASKASIATNLVQIYLQPANIFDLAFFVKVVDVTDIRRREESDELALLSLLLLGGGTQGASGTQDVSGTQAVSLENPLATFLLLQAFLPRRERRHENLPLLATVFAMQGFGTQANVTQANLLLPLALLFGLRSEEPHHVWRDWGELEHLIRQHESAETEQTLNDLAAAVTNWLSYAPSSKKKKKKK